MNHACVSLGVPIVTLAPILSTLACGQGAEDSARDWTEGGVVVQLVDDLDGEGERDLVITDPSVGSVWAFSIERRIAIWESSAGVGFGSSAAGVGDQDGDGLGDVAIGAPFDGRVDLLSGVSGKSFRSLVSPGEEWGFGSELCALTGGPEGERYLLVGAPSRGGGPSNPGGVYLADFEEGGPVRPISIDAANKGVTYSRGGLSGAFLDGQAFFVVMGSLDSVYFLDDFSDGFMRLSGFTAGAADMVTDVHAYAWRGDKGAAAMALIGAGGNVFQCGSVLGEGEVAKVLWPEMGFEDSREGRRSARAKRFGWAMDSGRSPEGGRVAFISAPGEVKATTIFGLPPVSADLSSSETKLDRRGVVGAYHLGEHRWLWSREGQVDNGWLGISLCSVEDIDGDGWDDVAVLEWPGFKARQRQGVVLFLFSGSDGAELGRQGFAANAK